MAVDSVLPGKLSATATVFSGGVDIPVLTQGVSGVPNVYAGTVVPVLTVSELSMNYQVSGGAVVGDTAVVLSDLSATTEMSVGSVVTLATLATSGMVTVSSFSGGAVVGNVVVGLYDLSGDTNISGGNITKDNLSNQVMEIAATISTNYIEEIN